MDMKVNNIIVPFGQYTCLNSNMDIEIFQFTPRNKDSGEVKFRVHMPGHRLVESRIANLVNYDSEYRYFKFKYKRQNLILKLSH